MLNSEGTSCSGYWKLQIDALIGATTIGDLLLDIRADVKMALLLYTPKLDGYFLDPYLR